MKLLTIFFLIFINITSIYANSQEEDLSKLTAKKLKQKALVIDNIITSSHPQKILILQKLLDGKSYYIKSNKTVGYIDKKINKKYEFYNFNNQSKIGEYKKSRLKKISINNNIRQKIQTEFAFINLEKGTPQQKNNALNHLYQNINNATINRIKQLEKSITDKDILKKMQLVFHIANLEHSDKNIQLQAIKNLDGNLEPIVKQRLLQLQSNDTDITQAIDSALKSIESKISISKTAETIFFGLSFGSVLVLAAIGLAITFGVMGVINMAHGELIMLGAYTTYVVQLLMPNYIDYSLFVAIPLAFLVSGFVGILIERGVIRHLHGRPLETLLATFGVSLILQQLVRTIFSPLNQSVISPSWMSGALEINSVLSLTYNRLFIIIFSLIVFAILFVILKKTYLGLQVRAVSQDRNMAKVMGIRSSWVDAMTFGLGSGIAGIAGVALSQLTNVGPNLGQAYIIDSFMVVVFGGVGNLWGTLVGGLSLGVLNKFIEPWMGAVLAKVLILIVIILFIQKRPNGLFPQKGRAAEN